MAHLLQVLVVMTSSCWGKRNEREKEIEGEEGREGRGSQERRGCILFVHVFPL